jgi:hypothetical protein
LADWKYTITHYKNAGGTQDLSGDVISIPMLTDTGSGEVNTAIIILNAVDGQYISDSVNSRSIILQHDIIKIRVTDGLSNQGTQGDTTLGEGLYEKFFNVVKKIPIKSKSEGVRVQIELMGVEKWLQTINYIKPHYFQNPAVVFADICDLYNANKGTGMPAITNFEPYEGSLFPNSKNFLPQRVLNVWDFGQSEDNCFDRMGDVIDKMGGSGESGGVLNFFDLKFEYDSNGTVITPHTFSSGNDPANSTTPGDPGGATIITINNSTAVNVGETDGGIASEEGTLINSWGADDGGSLPTDFSRFRARQQWFDAFFPAWETDEVYKVDAKASLHKTGVGKTNYEAKINHTSATGNKPPDATTWRELTSGDYYGNDLQYSRWTVDKRTIWINGGGDPNSSYGLSTGGSGYNNAAPTVIMIGGGGTGATATATVSGGVVTGYTITNGGSGYTTRPGVWVVSFNVTDIAAGAGGAEAYATVSGGVVTSILGSSPQPAFFDHNIVIRDGSFFRTWVDQIATSTTKGDDSDYSSGTYNILKTYLYDDSDPRNDTGDSPYRGFRVLIKGSPTGSGPWFYYNKDKDGATATAATVVDSNGRLLANSIIECVGKDEAGIDKWRVKYRPYEDQFAVSSDPIQMQVAIFYEGRTYEFYNDKATEEWTDITATDNGNDCWHPVSSLTEGSENITGLTPACKVLNVPGCLADYNGQTPKEGTANAVTTASSSAVVDVDTKFGWTDNDNSAVEFVFNWFPYQMWRLDGLPLIGNLKQRKFNWFYRVGAWASFRFPFPTSYVNATSEGVGDLYGGGTNTDNPREPATLDVQNMHLTHDGFRGFNHGGAPDGLDSNLRSSEDFGQISGIAFMVKLFFLRQRNSDAKWERVEGEDGSNFKMRCVLVDSADTVVTQDFTIDMNNIWKSITLPVGGFEVYRGRQPRYKTALEHDLYPPSGLDIQDIFLWRDVKLMSIFTLDSYDDFGRYHPGGAEKFIDETALDSIANLENIGYTNKEVRLTVDALHFVKPLLVNTGKVTTEVIDPDFIQRPEIGNYEQLFSDAEAERQKRGFQHVEFDSTTTGRFDVGFGDYYNLEDSDIIPSNLEDSAGTIKLVAKRIEYSITKPLNGKGGFLRRIKGVRRFT